MVISEAVSAEIIILSREELYRPTQLCCHKSAAAKQKDEEISQTPNLIMTVRGKNRRKSINSFVPKSLTAINFIILCRWTTDYIVNGLSGRSTWMEELPQDTIGGLKPVHPSNHPENKLVLIYSRCSHTNGYTEDPPDSEEQHSNFFYLITL